MAAHPILPPSELATWLRVQPTLTGTAPPLHLDDLPDDPVLLFREWLRAAAAAGVPEPHAATLATVDADGIPDARTLILKDVDARGWAFAGARSSRKAAQLGARPAAALNHWWQPQRRAVRVRGTVEEASATESDADLAARSASARGGLRPGDWVLWRVVPTRVEFWQGASDRNHTGSSTVVSTAAGSSPPPPPIPPPPLPPPPSPAPWCVNAPFPHAGGPFPIPHGRPARDQKRGVPALPHAPF